MAFPATPPTEMYLAIQLPNPISVLINYLPVSQTPIETLRHLVEASDVNAIVMDDFITWPHFVQPESPFRAYFSLLLERGAIPAIYLEGVRQASSFLTVAHGITLLNSVAPSNPLACFATGLFLTCTGNHVDFLPVSDMFWAMTPTLAAAHSVGELVMYHISQLHTEGPRLWQRSWRYVHTPACVGLCTYSSGCRGCFFYWYAREMCVFY